MGLRFPAVAAALVLALATGACASEPAGVLSALSQSPASQAVDIVRAHTGTFNGESVRYRSEVRSLLIPASDTLPEMRFVSTAYVREAAEAGPDRPVLFIFNGGPSAASTWLHMGALGPRRVVVPQDVTAPIAPPYQLTDNVQTVLDVADLVFIDPPETGFSRLTDVADRAKVYSADGDAQAVSAFVEKWLAAQGRSEAPVYLLGESYGTIRAALMAGILSDRVRLEGVVLFGQAVNIVETVQRTQNAVGYATNLPALAAIAAYHGRADLGGRSVEAFIDEVYAWAMSDYLDVLQRGASAAAAERRATADRLQRLTGISADYYLNHDLVISKVAFRTELLRERGLILGGNDARYVGPGPAPGERPKDPFAPVNGIIDPMLREHFTGFLGVDLDMDDYRIIAPGTEAWDWSPTGGIGIGGPFDDYYYDGGIKRAMEANPRFRLMIGTGIYDTLTTIGPARYLAARAAYPQDRILLREYVGGHMAYTHEPSLTAFTDDLRSLLTGPPLHQ